MTTWRLPALEALRPTVLEYNPAKSMYERIVKSIIEFEHELDETQEVGARLVNFGPQETIMIHDVGYWGPDLVKFFGKNANGHPVELLQHLSQVNVLLVTLRLPPLEHVSRRTFGNSSSPTSTTRAWRIRDE